jgi:hypothetical protein
MGGGIVGRDLKGLLKKIVGAHCHNQNHYGEEEGSVEEARKYVDPDLDSRESQSDGHGHEMGIRNFMGGGHDYLGICEGISGELKAAVYDKGLERMSSGVYKHRAKDMKALGDGGSDLWLSAQKKDSNLFSVSRRSQNDTAEIIYEEKSADQ